jgi:hypothetical protein
MMPIGHNCNASRTYQVDARTQSATTGGLVTPALGAITGITMRLAATRDGDAINPAVDDLPALERPEKAGRFYVAVSQQLHQDHLLPLGVGAPYFAIWYKAGEFDFYVEEYFVLAETVVTEG